MKNKKQIPIITITSGYRWNYFQWFLLGLYQLEENGEIKLKFRLPFFSQMLTKINIEFLNHIFDKIRKIFEHDSYNLEGNIMFPDGIRKTFCIDSADSPYLFDAEALARVNVYFKMQHPLDLDKDYFPLSAEVRVPWLDHKHTNEDLMNLKDRGERRICIDFRKYRYKIKPLMIGPRRLAYGIGKKSLIAGYDNYVSKRNLIKVKKFMCYFGNAKGPVPEEDWNEGKIKPDYDRERDIMGYYGDKISHPNEKRAIVADYISLLKESDARVISRGNSDNDAAGSSMSIPLKDFCSHISKFQYNFNVSGYRKSIPNRFIESFMVGTAIVTDKLYVKWYKPFDKEEVIETVDMGYLPIKEVNWQGFKDDIKSLPDTNPQKIIDEYNKKWHPEIVAKYIIDMLKCS